MSIAIGQEPFMNSLVTFFKGALVFVVSQAWNSAIQDLIQKTHFLSSHHGKLVYAFLITCFAVYILKILSRLTIIIEDCQKAINAKCLNLFKLNY